MLFVVILLLILLFIQIGGKKAIQIEEQRQDIQEKVPGTKQVRHASEEKEVHDSSKIKEKEIEVSQEVENASEEAEQEQDSEKEEISDS